MPYGPIDGPMFCLCWQYFIHVHYDRPTIARKTKERKKEDTENETEKMGRIGGRLRVIRNQYVRGNSYIVKFEHVRMVRARNALCEAWNARRWNCIRLMQAVTAIVRNGKQEIVSSASAKIAERPDLKFTFTSW